FLVVRTNRPAGDMEKAIGRAIASVDPNQPVFLSTSMRTLINDSLADRRFIMISLAITGCLALAMSLAGVYGVTSYIVSRRTQEIGIRMALGAPRGKVQVLVLRQGFSAAAVGLLIGTGLTVALTHVLRGLVAGLESANLAGALAAFVVISLTAAIACWLPARRASRIAPMAALRED
ncbi:MAG: FtsX-like permease family protein, partial [Terriglobales bacterium]